METTSLVEKGVDFENDAQVLRAIQLAIRDTLQKHKNQGQYVVGTENGIPVRVEPEDIVVPELPDEHELNE